MYLIKWRNRNLWNNFRVIRGLSKYPSREKAQEQINRFKRHWPHNTYYVVPV